MNMIKRLICIVLIAAMLLSAAACTRADKPAEPDVQQTDNNNDNNNKTDEDEDMGTEDKSKGLF